MSQPVKKVMWCPGRKYKIGSRVDTPNTAEFWGTSIADCDFCSRTVPVERPTGKLRGHRITITIHDEEGDW
jgi:hypothetical protein